MDHQHIIIMAKGLRNPPRTAETVIAWLRETVDAINMKIMMGPFAQRCDKEGNEGVTGVVVIETSHLSMHCWDTVPEPFLQADIYSCAEFDIRTVLEMFDRFRPDEVSYLLIDRNNGGEVVDKDVVHYW